MLQPPASPSAQPYRLGASRLAFSSVLGPRLHCLLALDLRLDVFRSYPGRYASSSKVFQSHKPKPKSTQHPPEHTNIQLTQSARVR